VFSLQRSAGFKVWCPLVTFLYEVDVTPKFADNTFRLIYFLGLVALLVAGGAPDLLSLSPPLQSAHPLQKFVVHVFSVLDYDNCLQTRFKFPHHPCRLSAKHSWSV